MFRVRCVIVFAKSLDFIVVDGCFKVVVDEASRWSAEVDEIE